jgi:predicted PurR-regulated permease PerM
MTLLLLIALLIVAAMIAIGTTTIGQQQLAYGWLPGTTEEQKNKIMTATDSLQLTEEEYTIANERMWEIFFAFQKKAELDAFDECGFSEAVDGFKVLQCWEKKGHTVR